MVPSYIKLIFLSTRSITAHYIHHRNPTVQKEAIRPIESASNTIPPRPYPMHLPQPVPLTLRVNLAWPIHLGCTSLNCGRKPGHLEETHADTGRTCKLHTDSDPRLESNPGPWSCEAAVPTTVSFDLIYNFCMYGIQ